MRVLFRPVWEGAQSALGDIFADGYPADKVIHRHLKANRKWGSHDRRLFAELVYDSVRWWRKLLFIVATPWPDSDRWTAREPKIFTKVIEAWCALNDVQIDRAIAKGSLDARALAELWRSNSMPRAVAQSIPDWLDAYGEAQLGEKWLETLKILNTVAPVYLRANRLKTTPDNLLKELAGEKIEAVISEADCVQLAQRTNVFLSKSFSAGHFEVQDLNSQRVVPQLQVEAGQRVIDACAGAGGKTLHMAAEMRDKGKIIALDVAENKLTQLRERVTRAGASTVEVRVIEGSKTVKRLKDSADRLLLDVPCSGIGVLRRNPDSKWRLTPGELEELKAMQAKILTDYSSMCKPGGKMVYSTCSIFPSENADQVSRFISQNETSWRLEHQETLWPSVAGPDGFFLARLCRTSSGPK